MANLAASELLKYEWRLNLFIKKYKNKEEFELTSGKRIFLAYIPNILKLLEKKTTTELNKITFLGSDGNSYKLSNLQKTAEFGGKAERSGTIKEDIELQSLIDQINIAKNTEKSGTIDIKIGTKIYKTYSAETTPGTPKSDFHLIDQEGKEIVWISHKDGKTPKDFQQWGGMSQRVEPKIYSHQETQKFINDVKSMFNGVMPRATTIARNIQSQQLQNFSVYGNDFGGDFGRQNVTLLLQGPVKLKKQSNYYILSANHVHLNSEKMINGFIPVFMAIYKGDRNNFGVIGARFAIQPLESRKITQFI